MNICVTWQYAAMPFAVCHLLAVALAEVDGGKRWLELEAEMVVGGNGVDDRDRD